MGKFGVIAWHDLTVADAPGVRDFYQQVVGWSSQDVDQGDYADFNMVAPDGEGPAAGICHARGSNKDIPPQWMIYITVPDLDASMQAVEANGGKVLVKPQSATGSRFCIIQDPAGAVAGLYQVD